jgi:hypothetical protein
MKNNLITGGMQFQFWLSQMGVSRPEGYRWRKKKMVKTERIGKTLFISQDCIDEFWRRVKAGEFAGELHGICAGVSNPSSTVRA